MSNAKLEAAESLRKLGRFMTGITQAADELEQVGSLENAATEAEARRDKAEGEARKILTNAADAMETARAQLFEAENARTAAINEAERVVAAAIAEGERLVAEAREAAIVEGNRVAEAANKRIAGLMEEEVAATGAANRAREARNIVNDELRAVTNQLLEARAALDEIRARIGG